MEYNELKLDMDMNVKICDFGLTQSMDTTHISHKEGGNGTATAVVTGGTVPHGFFDRRLPTIYGARVL